MPAPARARTASSQRSEATRRSSAQRSTAPAPASGAPTTDPADASPLVVVGAAPGAPLSSMAMIEACTAAPGGSSRAIDVIRAPDHRGSVEPRIEPGTRIQPGPRVDARGRQEGVDVDDPQRIALAIVLEERGDGMRPQRRQERVGHPTGIPTPGPSFGAVVLAALADVVQVTPVSGNGPVRVIASGGP